MLYRKITFKHLYIVAYSGVTFIFFGLAGIVFLPNFAFQMK